MFAKISQQDPRCMVPMSSSRLPMKQALTRVLLSLFNLILCKPMHFIAFHCISVSLSIGIIFFGEDHCGGK